MQISNKEALIDALENTWQAMTDWVNQQPESDFNRQLVVGKWTIAQTIYHLIKITRQINAGMKAPKLVLRGMFGKSNGPEKTYEEIAVHFDNLMESGSVSPLQYVSEKDRTFEKIALMKRFQGELDDFKKALNKWDEKSLSKYVLPHPELDKNSVREILFYVIWHNQHHLTILQRQHEMAVKTS